MGDATPNANESANTSGNVDEEENDNIQDEVSESDFSSDSDTGLLSASKFPSFKPNQYTKRALAAQNSDDDDDDNTNVSLDTNDPANDTEEEEMEDVKEEMDEKYSESNGKKRKVDGDEKKEKRKRGNAMTKAIYAVQNMPKYKSLKKNRRLKVAQDPNATNWHLPLYSAMPFPGRADKKKKRRRDNDTSRFLLQMTSSFEQGACKLDECVFEDARGTTLTEVMVRKFTPRKILRTLCKHLWNTTFWGVLTNGRRRSLYEANAFEKRLREKGASASLLSNVVEVLASSYALMDFVHIWFTDGSDEVGLRLSTETFRIATERNMKPSTLNTTLFQLQHQLQTQQAQLAQKVQQQASSTNPQSDRPSDLQQDNDKDNSESSLASLLSLPSSTLSQLPRPTPITRYITPVPAPKAPPPPATMDTALVLAKMLHDDVLRTRVYKDPGLLFDLCCSLGLDSRQDEASKLARPPFAAPTSPPIASHVTSSTPFSTSAPLSSSTPATPASSIAPDVPSCTSTPTSLSYNNATPSSQPSSSLSPPASPTPTRTTDSVPKLTITLTPKSPLAPPLPGAQQISPPSPSQATKRSRRRTVPKHHADMVPVPKYVSSATRRYHRRKSDSPKSPASVPGFPFNSGDPSDANDSDYTPIKQENEADDLPNSMAALRKQKANSGTCSSGNDSELRYVVESIDLGSDEEEKITFVATTKDGKRKRLYLTAASIKEVFPPETAKHYLAEVTKFREGSGNSSYRSVMRKKA